MPLHDALNAENFPLDLPLDWKVYSVLKALTHWLSDLFDEVVRYVRAYGIAPGTLTVLWHDCSKCDTKADVEVSCPLPRSIPSSGRIKVDMLPEVPLIASLAHQCNPNSTCRADADLARSDTREGGAVQTEVARLWRPRCDQSADRMLA
jgi:hypothetical protein